MIANSHNTIHGVLHTSIIYKMTTDANGCILTHRGMAQFCRRHPKKFLRFSCFYFVTDLAEVSQKIHSVCAYPTPTSTSKSFIEKIHRHIFNNHETETHEGLFASVFHGLSLHCKYSNLCWKSWLVQVHWNNKTCAWRSIYDWDYYCKYRD